MPIPKPRKGEDKNNYVSRCIRFLKQENSNMENSQATAICNTKWRERNNNSNWRKLNFSVPIEQSLQEGKDFLIKGIAINSTLTRNGVEFIPEELQTSAISLRNKPILKDHNNSVDSIVGRTTQNVNFNTMSNNVEFEAKIMDESIIQKIKDGRIQNVSVGAMVSELEESLDEQGNATHFIAKGIDFVELSLVAVPADPNAGLMQAIKMSYDLKIQQSYKMVEETKIKEKVNTEVKEDKKDFSINEQVLSMMQSITEQNKQLAEKINAIESKFEEQQIKESVEEDNNEEVETIETTEEVDETKGEVSSDVEESVDNINDLLVRKDGKSFSFNMNNYPNKFKNLSRGEY